MIVKNRFAAQRGITVYDTWKFYVIFKEVNFECLLNGMYVIKAASISKSAAVLSAGQALLTFIRHCYWWVNPIQLHIYTTQYGPRQRHLQAPGFHLPVAKLLTATDPCQLSAACQPFTRHACCSWEDKANVNYRMVMHLDDNNNQISPAPKLFACKGN